MAERLLSELIEMSAYSGNEDAVIERIEEIASGGETVVTAADVTVAAGDEGLDAGTLQAVLQDIYDILATKADA